MRGPDALGTLPSPSDLTRAVLDRCAAAGFERSGIATPEPSAYQRELHEWLEAGKQGTMAWLAEHLHVRTDPGRLLRGSRAIVMVAARYAGRGDADAATPEGHGRIARYARGSDYHRAFKKRLHAICDELREAHPGHECRAFTDIEPMPERELAARAGIGWIGKHTLVIEPRLGSWLALGGFATTLPLEAPPEQRTVPDHCGTCTRCIDACPTGCITPYSVDASRCISYLTIERREAIASDVQGRVGNWLFGCDVCQEVCPHNSVRGGDAGGSLGIPEVAGERRTLGLLDVLGWTPEDRTAALPNSVIKRATLLTLKRNAIVVIGNQLARRRDEGLVGRVRAIAADPDEPMLLRETAAGVLARLRVEAASSPIDRTRSDGHRSGK
ncbi:MAG: tRNA epoxyqueuosine(34) reductase QueG [Phycisphaeraceae bacterium]|nr:tRNA epoxyqueuosine(34) reductase QueG [Phycisphaeraceae bacterium]